MRTEVSLTERVIRVEGAMDVSCAAEMKEQLSAMLSTPGDVRLDLSQATDIDITAMQLLWAAAREAETNGISFHLDGDVPESIAWAVRDAGFENFPVAAAPKA